MGALYITTQCRRVRMSGRVVIFVALALLVVVAVCDETYDKAKADKLSKEELVTALIKSQTVRKATRSKLESARKQIIDLQNKMRPKPQKFNEKTREAKELKREAKLAKKEKLSDILMDHGAKYLALKTAKRFKRTKSDKQKRKTIAAARKGGRAGAVGPIRKVARATAVAAVK